MYIRCHEWFLKLIKRRREGSREGRKEEGKVKAMPVFQKLIFTWKEGIALNTLFSLYKHFDIIPVSAIKWKALQGQRTYLVYWFISQNKYLPLIAFAQEMLLEMNSVTIMVHPNTNDRRKPSSFIYYFSLVNVHPTHLFINNN